MFLRLSDESSNKERPLFDFVKSENSMIGAWRD